MPGVAVWIYGSLVKPGRFHDWSDVEVALESLPAGMTLEYLQSLLSADVGCEVDVCLIDRTRRKPVIEGSGERPLQTALVAFGFQAATVPLEVLEKPDTVLSIGLEPVRIDLLNRIAGMPFDAARENRVRGRYGATDVWFIGKDDLIRNKRSAREPVGRTEHGPNAALPGFRGSRPFHGGTLQAWLRNFPSHRRKHHDQHDDRC